VSAMLTERDQSVLVSVARYYTLTRAQINRLHFPEDEGGRITRKRLEVLLDGEFLSRTHMQVVNPAMGAPAPVYYPSAKGCAWLAQEREDDRFLAACTQTPNWQHLYHWVAVAETHITLDKAAERYPEISVAEWLGEWSVANPDEKLPEKRFRLYTRLSDHLVCVPDAAFLLEHKAHRKTFYLEQDRDTTKSAERVARHKCGGYEGLFERRGELRHFPSATVEGFSVLMIAPTARRRDALRKAISEKPCGRLWKFAAEGDVTPESFLTKPIWYPGVGEPHSLIKQA
jgi:Replication-relaxation